VVVTHEDHADELRICLAGEVDGSNADRLYAALSDHLNARPVRVCIDMTGLTFIDCAGLTVLQRLRRTGTVGDRIRLEGAVHPRVRRLLKLARPDESQAGYGVRVLPSPAGLQLAGPAAPRSAEPS
jgi:anti-anti-sigma factor